MQSTRRGLMAAAAAIAVAPQARAQGGWPDRPVRMIVAFPGGSTPDMAARAIASVPILPPPPTATPSA